MSELGHRSSTATSGRAVVGGVRGHGATTSEITSESAFEVVRGDYLGLTLARRRAVLEAELPYGTEWFVGLFTEMPDRTGLGGVEVDLARVSISRWVTVIRGANARRTNARALTWGALASEATLVGWGVWTAATEGELRAFDFLRNDDFDPITHTIAASFAPGLAAGRIGLVF